MYKNYIFNHYGTLVDVKTNEMKDEIWEKMSLFYSFKGANYEPDELRSKFLKFRDRMLENSKNPDKAEINIEDVFYQLFKKKKVKVKMPTVKETARMFRILSLELLDLKPYSKSVMEELIKEDKNIYLYSNGQASFIKAELISLGLDKCFTKRYISSEFGIKKSDKKLLELLIKENKLNPKKTVMVSSDYEEDFLNAKKVGIDSILIGKIDDDLSKNMVTYHIKSGDLREILTLD